MVSPRFAFIAFVCHLVLLIWFLGSWQRSRLLLYDFKQVASEANVNASPIALAEEFGFVEDDVADLGAFRTIAEPLVAGATSPGQRARRLADYLYSLRMADLPDLEGDVRQGPSSLLARMRAGESGNCGQMSVVLAAFWRSLGGHTRGVRWATSDGEVGHYAVELWNAEVADWFYYDMNLNGYGVDDDGVPLSVAALRSNVLTSEDLVIEANPRDHDYTVQEFKEEIAAFPVEWYVLSNRSMDKEPGRRFGPLRRYGALLQRLPDPWDRVLDNITGDRDRRLIVNSRVQIAGLTSLAGGRWLVGYLVSVLVACLFVLSRYRRLQPALSEPSRID